MIRHKMMIIVFIVSFFVFISLAIPFNFIYEDYYISEQNKMLIETFNELNFENKTFNEFIYDIYMLESSKNINFIIVNENKYIEYSTNKLIINDKFEYFDIYDNSSDINPLKFYFADSSTYRIVKYKNKTLMNEGSQLFSYFYYNNQRYSIIMEKVFPDFISSINNIVLFMFLWMIPTSIVASILISKTSDIIIKPISLINKKSKDIANLDFSNNLKVTSRDELGELSNNIQIMSDKLEEKINEINKINKKLEASLKKDEVNIKAQKEFIANISHELKTPITLINGYSEALLLNIDEESKIEYLNIIKKESNNMNSIIQELIEIAKLQSNHNEIKHEKTNLTKLTSEVLNKYRILIDKQNIKIELNIEDECYICGDAGKIKIVLNNFILNSIKHVNEKKYIRINIYKDSSNINFKIYNSGEKINDDELELIWSNFYKVDKSHSRNSGGTGIGLYISKIILELHDYEYGVRNIDDGVEFFFSTIEE